MAILQGLRGPRLKDSVGMSLVESHYMIVPAHGSSFQILRVISIVVLAASA